MSLASPVSSTACALGEGPLWHPERGQLFWFDIDAHRLYTREDGIERHWQFDLPVSAAGWIDRDTLLVASAKALLRFDLRDGSQTQLVALEADDPRTRSNDGRADPWGGFWIGTMGRTAEPGLGAIYRFYRGELRKLASSITISNAICFAPDRQAAYYCDTADGRILRQPLDGNGWPCGAPSVFVDARGAAWGPDGAVVDAQGCLWNAQWGASRVARYGEDGTLLSAWPLPVPHVTCPAFGGPGLSTLFVTTAADGTANPGSGVTYALETGIAGQLEHRVIA